MRSVFAFLRVGWLTAASYRVGLAVSLIGFIVGFIPLFFVAAAIEPIVRESISLESAQYFSFLVVGLTTMTMISAAMGALPGAISGNISSGTLEAILATPVTVPQAVVGMSMYAMLWSLARAAIVLVAMAVIGVDLWWHSLPLTVLVLLLLIVAYFSVALVAASLVLVFRTSGPLISATIAVSGLLGGVYYSTTVIPSWLQNLTALVPLTYGLRAMRRLLLTGATATDVRSDLLIMALFAAVMLLGGAVAFAAALRHSRRFGTLAQY